MSGRQSGPFLNALLVAAIGLFAGPAAALADDAGIIIIRDVPPHVPYRAIPPGQVESRVTTSPASQVNSAVGNEADPHNQLLAKELSDTEFAVLGSANSGGLQARLRQEATSANMEMLGASTSNAGQLDGLSSMFGGAGSMLSNNVNGATANIGRTITGSLMNLGGR